ncbi:MAG: TonB-dependent receptor, partial [Gemmatimonadota bacterium]|nr:TonB-dependent receptor [Gemmatimonadota bacterium]
MQAPASTRNALRFASGSLLLLALALLAAPAVAQTTVTGRVLNENDAPLHSATIQLLLRSDSSLVRGALADRQGNFVLEQIKPGTYLILVSHIGYRKFYSDALALADERRLAVGPFVLQPDAIELQGVAVEATKPLYQQRGDRLVINVESSPTLSGTSALQVLERSPGIVIDKMSNAISLIGKDGVRVLINGKLSYIPADGLVQYLAGMSADNLERIELITSPPASLDAEGNAGYINLVMKRSPDDGLNGSVTLSGGYGEGEVGDGSTSLSYQQGRASLFGNYSFSWDAREQTFSNFRRVIGTEGVTEMPAMSWRDRVQRNHNARMGMDYRVNDRTTLGALVAAYDNRWSMDALNRLTVLTDGTPVTRVESNNEEVNHWRHSMGNLNLQHKLGGAGTLQM